MKFRETQNNIADCYFNLRSRSHLHNIYRVPFVCSVFVLTKFLQQGLFCLFKIDEYLTGYYLAKISQLVFQEVVEKYIFWF